MAGCRGRPSDRAVQSTILSIKEVVGGHSDDDIYAALRGSNMDPNETAQKLLNQGPFHEVKRKRDKKRENADHKCFVDTKELVVQAAAPWVKSQTHWNQNGQRRAHDTNQSSGPSPEFRIVRDNRFQQGAVDHRPEPRRRLQFSLIKGTFFKVRRTTPVLKSLWQRERSRVILRGIQNHIRRTP